MDNLSEQRSTLLGVCCRIAASLGIGGPYWQLRHSDAGFYMSIDFARGTGFSIRELQILVNNFDHRITSLVTEVGEFRLYLR